MPNYRTAEFRVKKNSESLKRCLAAIEEFVAEIKRKQSGTLMYVSLQDLADDGRFLHMMAFENEAAEAAHRDSEECKKFVGALYPELAPVGPAPNEEISQPKPVFRPYRMVAGKM